MGNKKYNNLYKLALMVIISCITQVISLMKTSIVAGTFGVSYEIDAFNFANSVATFIFSFMIAGISAVVIPCYVKENERKSTDSFLTIIFIGTFIIASVVLLFRESIISVITGKNVDFVCLAGNLLIILVLSNLFNVLTSVTSAYFQYIENYNLPKVITLFCQMIVVAVLFISNHLTIYQYATIIGVSIAVSAVVDVLFAVKYGWKYSPALNIRDEKTKQILNTFVPVLFSTGVYQISLMVDSAIASRLNVGDITVLNYANQISSMVNTLIVNNLLIYFYPKLVKDIEQKKSQYVFWEKTYFFHAIICLIIAGYATVGSEGVSILFEHGKFSKNSTQLVYVLSLIYIVAQQINVVRDLIYRYFYSWGDTKSTTVNSVIVTVVNVIISIVLVKFVGLHGIVIGTALSSIVSLTCIMIKFSKKFGFAKPILQILIEYEKTILITAITILVVLFSKKIFLVENKIIAIIIYGIETVIVYIILTWIFNPKIKKIAMQI